jgi:hypothetical protein
MKKHYLTPIIVIFLFFCNNGIHAQATQTKLNQVELMKQQLGFWKCNDVKDTTAFWDSKSFGIGYEDYLRIVTRGEIIWEQKHLIGYDKSTDKYIGAVMGEDIGLCAMWFITDNKYEVVPYKNISNPEQASWKCEVEFKSPDMFIETYMENGKTVWSETYKRVK